MKDECAGKPALEFIGPTLKMYRLRKDEHDEHAKVITKGIKQI